MQGVHLRAGGVAVARRAGGAGSLVDVFAVDVNGIGPEGGASVTAASVALLKPKELDLGLEPFKECRSHSVELRLGGFWRESRGEGER